MRESLLEKLKKNELSFINEFERIYKLSSSYPNWGLFIYAFKKSPFSVHYNDFEKILKAIFEIDNNFILDYNDDVSSLIFQTKQGYANLTLDCFLDYLELFRTLLSISHFYNPTEYSRSDLPQILSIVEYDCNKLGYSFLETKNFIFNVKLKNPIAESIALQQKTNVKEKIYDFLSIRKGRVEEKREKIKSLADDVELICKKYSNIKEYDKLKQFIQCARHTKEDPIKSFPFYYKDEEKWLDKTFEMIIGVLSFTETKNIVSDIISKEKQK